MMAIVHISYDDLFNILIVRAHVPVFVFPLVVRLFYVSIFFRFSGLAHAL